MPKRRSLGPRAIISGQAGVVVFVDGSKSCNYRRVGEAEYHPCRAEDVPYLVGDASDAIVISGKSAAQADRILENEWKNDRALHLVLILIDGGAHLRAKRIAADSLEDILTTPTVYQFVRHRLYARTVPATADLDEAVRMSSEYGGKILWGMLVELRKHQAAIERVRERWERLDIILFGTMHEKRHFEQIAIEEGMFFGLCVSAVGNEVPKNWVNNLRLKGVRSRKEILEAWALPFAVERKDVDQETQGSFDEIWARQGE
jgi:hypothetical protein